MFKWPEKLLLLVLVTWVTFILHTLRESINLLESDLAAQQFRMEEQAKIEVLWKEAMKLVTSALELLLEAERRGILPRQ